MQTAKPHGSYSDHPTLEPWHGGATIDIPKVFPIATRASAFTFPSRVGSGKLHAKQLSRSTAPMLTPDLIKDHVDGSVSQAGGLSLDEAGARLENAGDKSLDEDLRDALVKSQGNGMRFLPVDALHRIVTPDRVRQELETLGVVLAEDADDLTEHICGISFPKQTKPLSITVRQKIFAILVMLEMVPAILDFVSHDLHDEDLPFTLKFGPSRDTYQVLRSTRGGASKPVSLFDSTEWKISSLESFGMYQWMFLVPYFRLSTNSQPWVLQYNFNDNIVLPMMKTEITYEGGFGQVRKVKIHPAHHNLCPVCILSLPNTAAGCRVIAIL
jgi:hypothetical protein